MQLKTVILGTGGTIAGAAASATDAVRYTAGQRSVGDLVSAVPALRGRALELEQVAQVDSKDMSHALWQRLARRAAHHLARADVQGVVVTHGTDTLEETAWFLHRVLAPARPLVLTAAMRPATSLQADGPQNLLDAVTMAGQDGARGVMAVLAGTVHAAGDLRKVHPFRLDAFSSGEAGPMGRVEDGRYRALRPWPVGQALGLQRVSTPAAKWPWVEIVASHAGARGDAVDALVSAGVAGLVVAATGNGSMHRDLMAALRRARRKGVSVLACSRCADSSLVGVEDDRAAVGLTPWAARVELLLRLLGAAGARPSA